MQKFWQRKDNYDNNDEYSLKLTRIEVRNGKYWCKTCTESFCEVVKKLEYLK